MHDRRLQPNTNALSRPRARAWPASRGRHLCVADHAANASRETFSAAHTRAQHRSGRTSAMHRPATNSSADTCEIRGRPNVSAANRNEPARLRRTIGNVLLAFLLSRNRRGRCPSGRGGCGRCGNSFSCIQPVPLSLPMLVVKVQMYCDGEHIDGKEYQHVEPPLRQQVQLILAKPDGRRFFHHRSSKSAGAVTDESAFSTHAS
mmetsp:Transcript_51529/g.130986  ORF Transcript_51529/g.130986 Transcript_51529/m.130986 type:complete len:204 (+) Transcript_51529:151-762(+)